MWTTWASKLLARVLPHRWARPGARLTPPQRHILHALTQETLLKSHRTVDGEKRYCLHRADGSVLQEVAAADIEALRDAGLIVGNMKFPAATYLLTEAGLRMAATAGDKTLQPLTPRASHKDRAF
jgi:hypothetical protein